jgi:hypothetical protein
MVARRKATTTTTARVATQHRSRQTANSDSSGDGGADDDPIARELARLQAMRADARTWLAVIERRIMELEQVASLAP